MADARLATSKRKIEIVLQRVIERSGKKVGDHPFIVLGDFNDYLETDTQGKTGIDKLVRWNQVENVVDRLPKVERWTHFFKGNKSCQLPPKFSQLDYLLLSRSLAASNPSPPIIERRGQPKRADRYSGPRFPGVGTNDPKASDHCPVVMEVSL